MELRVEPMSDVLGARVTGIDLRDGLDDATFAELRRIWLDHLVTRTTLLILLRFWHRICPVILRVLCLRSMVVAVCDDFATCEHTTLVTRRLE